MRLMLAGWFFLAMYKTSWILAKGFVDSIPGCFDSCSNQVNCTISPVSYGFCGAGAGTNMSHGPDIAAEPVQLEVEQRRDDQHQFIFLSWRPPNDGSYNFLTGFLVQVTAINLDPSHTGVIGTICYQVVPAPDWYHTHRRLHDQGGVAFFMNCLQVPEQATMDLVISIHSMPLKPNEPKLAVRSVHIRPDGTNWNPRFERWADANDVMHLIIQNPLKEARYYHVQVKSVEKDRVVFNHNFPASPDNKTVDELVIFGPDGLPHYLVPGLSKEDNYSIVMDFLDANKTNLPHYYRVQTNPFKLNFTSVTPEPSALISQGLDNRLVIIVSSVALVVMALLVCLVWKGIIRPRKLRDLGLNCAYKLNGISLPKHISFHPIYCHENDNYVAAVELHVVLLRRCLKTHFTHKSSKPGTTICCVDSIQTPAADINTADCNVIIYLSPRLGEILKFGQVCPAECTKIDVQCHQALLALSERCRTGRAKVPLIVTFDCFEKAELGSMDDLKSLIFPTQSGVESEPPPPLRLASFNSNGWRIENIELLFYRLHYLQDISQSTPLSLHGWRDCEEAKAVERYLSLLAGEAEAIKTNVFNASWKQTRFTGSQNLETIPYSNSTQHSREDLVSSFGNPINNLYIDSLRNSTSDLKSTPYSPLISSSSGFQSGSVSRAPNTFLHNFKTPGDYVKSSVLDNEKQDLPPALLAAKDQNSYQPLYRYSPTNIRGYRPHNTNDISNSRPIRDGQTETHLESVVMYKPNINRNDRDNDDSFSLNSVDCDIMLRTKDADWSVDRPDQFSKEADDTEWTNEKDCFRMTESKAMFIPPSLIHSNHTSMESVCERINRVNEYSGWSDLNLSK